MSKLIPVIHALNEGQVVNNARIVHESGAFGCFLINHSINVAELDDCYKSVRKSFPQMWIGTNYLGAEPVNVYDWLPKGLDGLWIDSLDVDEEQPLLHQPAVAKAWSRKQRSTILFGGVAFKYQRVVSDFGKAAEIGSHLCNVVTTSGVSTGVAPGIEKVQQMKAAIGDRPLAVASGMTLENVSDFVPYVEYFLVASGISETFHELDPEKVKKMVALVSI